MNITINAQTVVVNGTGPTITPPQPDKKLDDPETWRGVGDKEPEPQPEPKPAQNFLTLGGDVRDKILKLAMFMEHRLQQFDGQPGKMGEQWRTDGRDVLLQRLASKLSEFETALKGDTATLRIAQLAADAANYVMMLADNAGAFHE